jgi:hypothetical protein
MPSFTIRGEVIPFIDRQRNIRVHNVAALRQFWADEDIDTDMDWDRREVLITLSKEEFVDGCDIGDTVDYTIESWDRADGRRIRGVALQVIAPLEP